MDDSYTIETILQRHQGSCDYYELKADHGYTDLVHNLTVGWLGVANVYVEPRYRRRGLGKVMLHQTLELAHNLDVKLLYGALISRESIHIFTSVFGPEAVEIHQLGDFSEPGAESGSLSRASFSYKLC